MPTAATIHAPAGKRGLVQWAEDSTGGEAYIPLRGGARSRNIWVQTGRLLGVFDQGGLPDLTMRTVSSRPRPRWPRHSQPVG